MVNCSAESRIPITCLSVLSTMHTYMYMETYKISKNVQRIFKFVYTTFLSMAICLPMPTAIVHVCVVQTYMPHTMYAQYM